MSAPITRHEDWRHRRAALSSVASLKQIHRDGCIEVLDHLLSRPAGAAEATAPARFPMRPGMRLDHRGAVVHYFLGPAAAIRAQTPPSIRAAVILGRIARLHPHSPARTDVNGAAFWQLAQVETRSVYWSLGAWQDRLITRIGRAVQAVMPEEFVYLTVLDSLQLGPKLPEWAILYLFDQLDNPAQKSEPAAGLFVCCQNESVLDYAVLAWRDRLAANGPDAITRGLSQVFFRPHWKQRAQDKFRAELASGNAAVRVEALRILEDLGDFDDLSMILDLLAMPPLDDEDPCERDALLHVARRLAGLERYAGAYAAATRLNESSFGTRTGTKALPPAGDPATLHDDWLRRRSRLTHLAAARHPYVELHRRTLDYLLEHYRDSTQAAQRARFAAPSQPFKHRQAIILYHQLGRAEVKSANTAEASRKASAILQRIRKLDPQASAADFATKGEMPAAPDTPLAAALAERHVWHSRTHSANPATEAQKEAWEDIEREVDIRGVKAHARRIFSLIDKALDIGASLPERAVFYLIQHVSNPEAVALLSRCCNPSAVEYVFGVWRKHVVARASRPHPVPRGSRPQRPEPRRPSPPSFAMPRQPLVLFEFFNSPERRALMAEKLRREILATDSSKVRLQAIRLLSRLGTLDDVGLFSDLLCLPRFPNEDPRERPALLRAMCKLAGADPPAGTAVVSAGILPARHQE